MKKKYKIHFTLSWSTVAFLALAMLACKSCSPAHAHAKSFGFRVPGSGSSRTTFESLDTTSLLLDAPRNTQHESPI